ncbi:hypothetical protein K2P97_09310 [bacterium]|nr:hypothetical protein [bacterium]
MKITISVLLMLLLSSCISQLINAPINYKSGAKPGVSKADTLAMFDFPSYMLDYENKTVMVYSNTGILFVDNKQSHVFTLAESENIKTLIDNKDLRLNPASGIPDGLTNSIVFNKDSKNKLSPYQAFAFLGDEANFIEAIKQKFVLDTYNTSTNTLCLALSSGFVEATKQALEAGAYKDATLKDVKTGRDYIRAHQCTKYLQDPVKLAAIDKLLNPPVVVLTKEEAEKQAEVLQKKEETKSNEVVEGILNWLKPVEKAKAEKVPQPSEKK